MGNGQSQKVEHGGMARRHEQSHLLCTEKPRESPARRKEPSARSD